MPPRFVRIQAAAGAAAALAALLCTPGALAQSWTGARTTPRLSELLAVDATGEANWLYGSEDLAGDGETFDAPERGIDIRTAYAATNAQDLLVRTYFSGTTAPGAGLAVYVFIDSDATASTGGTAEAANIDPKLVNVPSSAGYEWVVGLGGDAAVVGLWEWDGVSWATTNFAPNEISVEVDVDLDPIRINEESHGYIQGMIDLTVIGLTEACNANLYVRSTNDAAGGEGDLQVAQVAACDPGSGIPDPLDPGPCTSDDQCPGDGVCVNGSCVIAVPCVDAADCPANYECTADGRCVPQPSGTCTDNSECNGLVCSGGQCVACTLGGNECGAGQKCAPDGRCVSDNPGSGGTSGVVPEGDQEVQGGACVCSAPSGRSSTAALLLFALPLAFALRRLRRRTPR